MTGLAAVAVEEHGIALACPGGCRGKVGVFQRADLALVLQQLIAVGSGTHNMHAVDGIDHTAISQIADISFLTLRLGGRIRIAGIGSDVIVTGQSTCAGVENRIVVCGIRRAAGNRTDFAVGVNRIAAACGNGAGAVDGFDGGRCAVGGHVMELDAADLVAVGVDGLCRELAVIIDCAVPCCPDLRCAGYALDDAAGGVAECEVGCDVLGVIGVLIGLDFRSAADCPDHAAGIIQRAAVVGVGRCILSVDAAIGNGDDGGTAVRVLLVLICAGQAAVGAAPQAGVIPPVAGVEDGIALGIPIGVGCCGADGIDLRGVGMSSEGRIVQLVDNAAIVDGVLTDCYCGILDQLNLTVTADRTSSGGSIAISPDIAVVDSVAGQECAAGNGADMAAVVPDSKASVGFQCCPGDQRQVCTVIGKNHAGIRVYILGAFQRAACNCRGGAIVAAYHGDIVAQAAVVLDGVGHDPSASGTVLNGQRPVIIDHRFGAIIGGGGGQSGYVFQRTAVKVKCETALILDGTPGSMSVQVQGNIGIAQNGIGSERVFFLIGSAVSQHFQIGTSGTGQSHDGFMQRGIIGRPPACGNRSHCAGVEAVDIGRSAGGLTHGDCTGKGRRSHAVAQLPGNAVVPVGGNAHGCIRRGGS